MDHVTSNLVRKRAEIAGQLELCREQASVYEQQIHHLDQVLAMFGHDVTVKPIKPTYKRQQGYFSKGELVRLVLDCLRLHGPCDRDTVLAYVMEKKGFANEDRINRSDLQHKISKTLKRKEQQGVTQREGESPGERWSLRQP